VHVFLGGLVGLTLGLKYFCWIWSLTAWPQSPLSARVLTNAFLLGNMPLGFSFFFLHVHLSSSNLLCTKILPCPDSRPVFFVCSWEHAALPKGKPSCPHLHLRMLGSTEYYQKWLAFCCTK
jgi:hypothetical protein